MLNEWKLYFHQYYYSIDERFNSSQKSEKNSGSAVLTKATMI